MATKTKVEQAPMSAEERALVSVNTNLARLQLANLKELQPFQRELLQLTMGDLRRQGAESAAFDAAVTPEQRAAASKAEFERSQRLGPIQDELLQLQLEEVRRGGAASPEQLARIKEATDRGIEAGSADIDTQTGRGIGLIADELANSRGLRLSDSPIMHEAGFLARAGEDQKASLIKNLRAGEASAALNLPLAASQITSGINLNQQNLAANAQQFQADLRQRAFQNRLALTGTTANTGIGLSSRGATFGPQSTGSSSSGSNPMQALMGVGALAAGVGALAPYFAGGSSIPAGATATMGPIALGLGSDRRIKRDHGIVGKTRDGIDLHAYHYKWESDNDPLRLGVMAQDVEKVKPEAVLTRGDGLKFVDYARI